MHITKRLFVLQLFLVSHRLLQILPLAIFEPRKIAPFNPFMTEAVII